MPSVLKVRKLETSARIPVKGSKGAAGYDLFSIQTLVIAPHQMASVRTGIAVELPENTYGRIAARSSLAVKHRIAVEAGVIDSDYRGHVIVLLTNHSDEEFKISAGDRIAQLLVTKLEEVEIVEDLALEPTERGEGGFGSTGTNELIKPQNGDETSDQTSAQELPTLQDVVLRESEDQHTPVLQQSFDKETSSDDVTTAVFSD